MKMKNDGIDELMTPEEVCDLLKIKKQRLYEWVHFNKIHYIKVGRFLRFSRSKIIQWLEANAYDIIPPDEIRSE